MKLLCGNFLRAIWLAASVLALVASLEAQITVVDAIPASMSDETFNNTEPFLAVDPTNPLTIVASPFMLTPAMATNGPLLVSKDGGATWSAPGLIPGCGGCFNTGDITIHYVTSNSDFFAGILSALGGMRILRSTDPNLATPFTSLSNSPSRDQPYTNARTVLGWFDPGKERIWVGNNNAATSPKSATIDQSLDAAVAVPVITTIGIDQGTPFGRDNYQTRPVSHADGHVYAAFYRRTGSDPAGYTADVVVVRDDNWGKTVPPFQNLVDSGSAVVGQRVVSSVPITDDFSGSFGNEIIGGDLFLTVDPNNSGTVYISWADKFMGNAMTLHLRRSTDFGQNWGSDLLQVPSAKNGAIAINSQGHIGYCYQQLTGTSPNRHWQTHLRRSLDGVTWDDTLLSDFPAEGANAPPGFRIIGDYLDLVAVGHDFYGVFSADNDLVNASFPAGVTFQRNHDATHFLGNNGVTQVAASVDPFFFKTTELDHSSDFYVRDWTDSATSHDNGAEPSTHANFFDFSDVWNRRTNDPDVFDANDRPQSQDAQPAAMGHNFAFARVSREVTNTDETVNLHFLYSDGGVGVNFVDAGATDPTLHFNVGDAQNTATAGNGYQWDLPSGASNHVCLAVQIYTTADPFIPPSLAGHAPGWPNADLMIINDNNKAQRNMQVLGYGGMAGGTGMAGYLIAHNAATFARDMQIGVDFDPSLLRHVRRPQLTVIGGPGPEPKPITPHLTVTLPKMMPAENRWLEIKFDGLPGKDIGPMPIRVYEIVNGLQVNGYAIAARALPEASAIRENLGQHAAVFSRLASAFEEEGAKEQAARAQRLLEEKDITGAGYRQFLKKNRQEILQLSEHLADKSHLKDPFGTLRLAKLLGGESTLGQALADHLTLLNKLDATQTMVQKAKGDPADMFQLVAWQIQLYSELPQLRQEKAARHVIAESQEFLDDFGKHRRGADKYPALLRELLKSFHQTAESLEKVSPRLEPAVDRIEDHLHSASELEGAHRDYLLALQKLAK